MKRAAIYVRVSTQEQKTHGLSVDNQIVALQAYCQEHGYIVADIYNDAGISARKRYTRRPALLQMVNDCKAGKIDILLFTKLDRFFRSVGDYYDVMNQINIPWRAIWEDYETETSAGMFKVNIMLSVAQAEADRTSERVKATMAYKIERGDYVGAPSTGYKIQGRNLVVDESLKPAVEAFFQTYLKTFSTLQAMRAANEKGLKLNKDVARDILHSPTYKGTTVTGHKCYAFITEEEYQIIQAKMATRVRTPKCPERFYYFSGLMRCGCCGKNMISRASFINGTDYKSYICSTSKSETTKNPCPDSATISERKLEKYLLSELDNIISQYEYTVQITPKDEDNTTKIKALESKLDRLSFLFEEGDLSIDEYRAKRDAIRQDISALTVKTAPPPKPLPPDWKAVYDHLDEQHKKQFWNSCIRQIVISPNKKDSPTVYLY